MCTLTWGRNPSGELEVYFNRDERKTRPVAMPPSIYQIDGVRFLSPRDPKGGGTWMIANEFGLVVCLLNKWEMEGRLIDRPKSRGQLVWQMAGIETIDQVESFLGELGSYPAFTLVALSGNEERRWDWDGAVFSECLPVMPITSSSFNFEDVKAAREAAFAEGRRGEELHASIGEAPSAFTIRMNRPDAQTWSRSHLKIGKEIVWEYLAEQEDLVGEGEETVEVLPLR